MIGLKSFLANYRHKENLICTIKPYLIDSGMDRFTAEWMLNNIKQVNDDTLKLSDYMCQNGIENQIEYLRLSKAVKFQNNFEQFVDMYEARREWLQTT